MRSRVSQLFALSAVAVMALVGFTTGAALAQTASTGWVNYANWTYSGNARCADGKGTVYTAAAPDPYNPVGVGYVRYRAGSPCTTTTLPAGYLGAKVFLARGDGTICGVRDWTYNTYPLSDFSTGVGPNCSYAHLRAVAQARVYRANFGDWKISDYLDSGLVDG